MAFPSPSLLLGILVCVIFGGNNASSSIGTSVGAGLVNLKRAALLAASGVIVGLLLEGAKLSKAISGGILLSYGAGTIQTILVVTIFVMGALTLLRIPLSLSQVTVGAGLGLGLLSAAPMNWSFAGTVVLSWVLSVGVSFLLAATLQPLASFILRRIRNMLLINSLYQNLTLASSFYVAYALGANTLGLIIGLVSSVSEPSAAALLALLASTVVGIMIFGMGTTRSVAENITGLTPSSAFSAQLASALTVHAFTQFGIPVSISEAVVGAVMGVSLSKRIVIKNTRMIRQILLGWIAAPLIGMSLAVAIANIAPMIP